MRIRPTDPNPEELAELFETTSDLDAAGRGRALRDLRALDVETADRLEALLLAHDARGSFLDRPLSLEGLVAGEAPPADELEGDPSRLLGRRLGDYTLVELLGVGGSGLVYAADQGAPRRRVAVKVLRGSAARLGAAVRFEEEAEILARLSHPHVARVFGAGRTGGEAGDFPWLAVELIPEPLPLTDFAERAGLDLEGRVRLFLPVCDAVHHAHRKGVLHRDLKPANILVPASGEGGARVIDFGLARHLAPLDRGEQVRTRSGELLGTLRYMSPEQCDGDPARLDVRSDVYSLGVVLYELLSGGSPYEYERESVLAILEAIRTAEPRDPTPACPELAGDLHAILRKALSKEPEERYDSAADLAEDLDRWTRAEPVLARRSPFAHRLRLFARRRRALFWSLLLGSAAGFAALFAIVFLYVQARAALADVRRAEERAQEQERLVEAARSDLDLLQVQLGVLGGGGEGEVGVPFAEAFVRQARRATDSAESLSARRLAVEEAVERLGRAATHLARDADSTASLAEAFVRVGDLHGSEWTASPEDSRGGHEAYSAGLGLWRRVVAERPDDARARRGLISNLCKLADSHRKLGTLEEGRSLADEAVLLSRRELERDPDRRRAVRRLAHALGVRGDAHISLQPYQQGLEDSREGPRVARGTDGSHPRRSRPGDRRGLDPAAPRDLDAAHRREGRGEPRAPRLVVRPDDRQRPGAHRERRDAGGRERRAAVRGLLLAGGAAARRAGFGGGALRAPGALPRARRDPRARGAAGVLPVLTWITATAGELAARQGGEGAAPFHARLEAHYAALDDAERRRLTQLSLGYLERNTVFGGEAEELVRKLESGRFGAR